MASDVKKLFFVEGDSAKDINVEIESSLLSIATIFLRIRFSSGLKEEKTAIIDDVLLGIFHFEWSAGQPPAGNHDAEIIFERVGDSFPVHVPERTPLQLIVRENV
jgi:hypothetical protein